MTPAALAVLLDVAFGEPPTRLHPVAHIGTYLKFARSRWRARSPRGQLLEGGAWWLLGATGSYLLGRRAEGAARRLPAAWRSLLLAVLLKPTFSVKGLLRAVEEVERPLASGDLKAAREMLAWHLVSRDTRELRADEVAGAALSSLFENLSDSVVGPLLAYRVGGLGGAYLYRFANTADAMWGYRTTPLEWPGKVAAHADDVLNLIPARLTAVLVTAGAPLAGLDVNGAARAWRTDSHRTPSPNGGHPMSAAAGALGVKLEKRAAYTLNGAGREPGPLDVRRGLRLAALSIALGAALLCWKEKHA